MPRLPLVEWLVYALLTAVIAVTNVYTTLLTGWSDGGSITAVLMSVLVLRGIGRRAVTLQSLNLGQTMASAGGAAGLGVVVYASARMADPGFAPHPGWLLALFTAVGVLGSLLGVIVRRWMVRYWFPSGTACAVILRSVAQGDAGEARRSVRLMGVWAAISAALTVPVKITLSAGGAALLSVVPFGFRGLAVSLDPIYYGVGVVVGPRVGAGMLIGGLAAPLLILPALEGRGFTPEAAGDWLLWMAIALLTLPTLAAVVFAYLFREPEATPAGFTPGASDGPATPRARALYAALGAAALIVTAIACRSLFGISPAATAAALALTVPLCLMLGRVTADTDVNPLLLAVLVIMSLGLLLVGGGGTPAALALIGLAVIVQGVAGAAVDMMQDHRTGHLVNASWRQQTSVQLLGVVVGALVAVPFILLLDARFGFGGTALPSPGAKIYTEIAGALVEQGTPLGRGLRITLALVSAGGCLWAFLGAWPRTRAWVPSVFGAGLGLLLPFEASAAIFLGGAVKWVAARVVLSRKSGDTREAAAQALERDVLAGGAGVFAASAVVSMLLILIVKLLERAGVHWFYLPAE